jgi:hypothetical protein
MYLYGLQIKGDSNKKKMSSPPLAQQLGKSEDEIVLVLNEETHMKKSRECEYCVMHF